MASSELRPDHLVWEETEVGGRPALYGHAGDGEGLPVLFLHGWALGHHSYKRPLNRLVRMGCRVYAPAQPGFGGTPAAPGERLDFGGYAAWAAAFLDAVGVHEPALVIGHSFGGGVAIQLAHDHPERVRSLVLVNSVGGPWSRTALAALAPTRSGLRPKRLWDLGLRLPRNLPLSGVTKVLPAVLEDAVTNVVRDPGSLWRVGNLARRADLIGELEELKRRELPVVVLWGDKDRIVPRESFASMCAALGSEGEVVAGNHSWLLEDPDAFGEVITNVVDVARMAREMDGGGGARRGRRWLRRRAAAGRRFARRPAGG